MDSNNDDRSFLICNEYSVTSGHCRLGQNCVNPVCAQEFHAITFRVKSAAPPGKFKMAFRQLK